MTLLFRSAAVSKTGPIRSTNQDSGLASSNIIMVADGMGGHAGGDIASYLAVHSFAKLAKPSAKKTPKPDSPKIAALKLNFALGSAHTDIVNTVEKYPHLKGMGTTISALYADESGITMLHLGDSRAYLLSNNEFSQISTDHSLVQRLIENGEITPEEAKNHPKKNIVIKVLGDFDFNIEMTPDILFFDLKQGDRILLCSDGICGVLSDYEIKNQLQRIANPAKCADKIVQLAIKAGSADNCTAVVADIVDSKNISDSAKFIKAKPQIVGAATDDTLKLVDSAEIAKTKASAKNETSNKTAKTSETENKEDSAKKDDSKPTKAKKKTKKDPSAELTDSPEIAALDGKKSKLSPKTKIVIWVSAIFILLSGIFFTVKTSLDWVNSQYYIGSDGENVLIYQGIPTKIAFWELSTLATDPGVKLDRLLESDQTSVLNNIPEDSVSAALGKIQALIIRSLDPTLSTGPLIDET